MKNEKELEVLLELDKLRFEALDSKVKSFLNNILEWTLELKFDEKGNVIFTEEFNSNYRHGRRKVEHMLEPTREFKNLSDEEITTSINTLIKKAHGNK